MDDRCVGFIAHSGMWRLPRTAQYRRPVPCLLMRTIGDKTPTYAATGEAFDFYTSCHPEVVLSDLPKTTWHGHEFANGLPMARHWCRSMFGFDLQLRY